MVNLVNEIKKKVSLAFRSSVYYIAVGTGTPTPSGLGSEIAQKQVTESGLSGDRVFLLTTFDTTEANGTLTEIALKDVDGNVLWTGTIDPPVNKTNTIKLLIGVEFTINVSI